VVVGSEHPHHPGVLQDVVEVEDVCDVFVAVGWEEPLLAVVAVLSLHPNQPGVSQVDVDEVVVVLELVVLPEVVVVSSKHPHHPGVEQVEVRVLVRVEVEVAVVLLSLLFPVTSFQRTQS